MKYTEPSGATATPEGRKFGFLPTSVVTSSESVSAFKPEPSSLIFARKILCALITLQLRKMPCQSSGKWRLVRIEVPAQGRDGRPQKVFMPPWAPESRCPLAAGPK